MDGQTKFHFKAATGYGAIVDGSVNATSAEQVTRDLMQQGLIPVRVTAEQRHTASLLSLGNLLRFFGVGKESPISSR